MSTSVKEAIRKLQAEIDEAIEKESLEGLDAKDLVEKILSYKKARDKYNALPWYQKLVTKKPDLLNWTG